MCDTYCRAVRYKLSVVISDRARNIFLAAPSSFAECFKMDQQFAEILADRPAATPKHEDENDDRHGHGQDEETQEPQGSNRQTTGRAKAAPGGHVHGHDRLGAQSVGVELSDRPIDWAKFTVWLKGFLEKEGDVIWRLKGVLWTSTPGNRGSNKSAPTWGWGAGRRTVVQVRQRGGRGESVHRRFCRCCLRSSFFPFFSECKIILH